MTTKPPGFDGKLPSGPFVAYRVNGFYAFRGEASQPGGLRSMRIVETKPLTDEQSSRLRAIITAKASFGGDGKRCFTPGVGFTIGTGRDAVEILVCLNCYWTYFFRDETKTIEALSEAGHRQLAEMYVELFPGDNPNLA